MDLTGKRVLLIGSGMDLNNRKLQSRIDNPNGEWDFIARVNKYYGDPTDVGTRTDLVFTATSQLVATCFPQHLIKDSYVVGFREGYHCDSPYWRKRLALLLNINHDISTGGSAIYWLLERGAIVDLIGFGFRDKQDKKVYCDGAIDNNVHYNWQWEYSWASSLNNVTFI